MAITLEFHIHGTTGLLRNFQLEMFKSVANKAHGDLFTPGTDFKLIPHTSEAAPASVKNYKGAIDGIVDEADRFYVQWSGGFDEERTNTAKQLANEIKDRIKDRTDDEPVCIVLRGHSHGGNIALDTIELLKDEKNVYFILDTTATPLNLEKIHDKFLIYKSKILSWQHFYHDYDHIAFLGTVFMQHHLSVYRRLEDLLSGLPKDDPSYAIPEGWQSHLLNLGYLKSFDAHNNSMRDAAAEQICKTMRPQITTALETIEEAKRENLDEIEFRTRLENKLRILRSPEPEPHDPDTHFFRHF